MLKYGGEELRITTKKEIGKLRKEELMQDGLR